MGPVAHASPASSRSCGPRLRPFSSLGQTNSPTQLAVAKRNCELRREGLMKKSTIIRSCRFLSLAVASAVSTIFSKPSATRSMRITKSDVSGWAATSILTHSPSMRSTEGLCTYSNAPAKLPPQEKPTRNFNNTPSPKGHPLLTQERLTLAASIRSSHAALLKAHDSGRR
jgi:hypothetical protein